MFTEIVEAMATGAAIVHEGSNVHFTLETPLAPEFKIDQSIAHNGACLTVVKLNGIQYTVTAIDETLQKTNLGTWQVGQKINLERCLKVGDRLDGHMVQGHVDTTGKVASITDENGSWRVHISYPLGPGHVTVQKGSICINGVSLTVVESKETTFSVAIIPYTFEHTNFHTLQPGDTVNLEFDILGKYIAKLLPR